MDLDKLLDFDPDVLLGERQQRRRLPDPSKTGDRVVLYENREEIVRPLLQKLLDTDIGVSYRDAKEKNAPESYVLSLPQEFDLGRLAEKGISRQERKRVAGDYERWHVPLELLVSNGFGFYKKDGEEYGMDSENLQRMLRQKDPLDHTPRFPGMQHASVSMAGDEVLIDNVPAALRSETVFPNDGEYFEKDEGYTTPKEQITKEKRQLVIIPERKLHQLLHLPLEGAQPARAR